MAESFEVKVPDIGDFDSVDVVEVLVAAGDRVAKDDSLITLESDKASMEVPSPNAGTIESVHVAVGDKVGEGALIVRLVREEAPAKVEEKGEERAEKEVEKKAEAPVEVVAAARSAARIATEPARRLVVLGAGPGGYSAAFRAADLGLEVTLVDREPTLGGVCLNVGCIPSKALLHTARVIDEAEGFSAHGVSFQAPKIDLDKLRGWKQSVVDRLTGGLADLARKRKVTVVRGEGRLVSTHELEVARDGESQRIGFDAVILAAGSRPVVLPGLPAGDPRIMDSTGALELGDVPRRLLVIGGGIIGLEMATVYAALGSKVSVVELLEGLIPGCDRDLVRPLHKRLAARCENIWLSTRVTGIKARKNDLEVSFEGADAPARARFDRVLVAVGRRPNGDLVGAEAAGVRVDERGFLPVDDQQRTNISHIFAIGDLVPGPMLAHKASHEGRVAAEVAAGHKTGFDARVIPSVAYTDPEVAWVGLTETEAKAKSVAYGKGTFPWAASGRSLGLGRDEGLTKLLFEPTTGRLLGAGMVGPSAGDLVAEATLAIEMGSDAHDLGLTIHPHPTLSETIAMAAEAFSGTIVDLYLPKRKG